MMELTNKIVNMKTKIFSCKLKKKKNAQISPTHITNFVRTTTTNYWVYILLRI